MSEHVLIGLAGIVALGIGAQWLAWRLHLPSILVLLVLGVLAGPVGGWLRPDALFGELFFPVVSLSVALILFEGGLSLNLHELRAVRKVVRRLISLGALVSWALGAVAARFFLGFSWPLAVLLGAILVVTGPTVIGPLLRHVRPSGNASSVLKWEGILIDPIGATLAVLTFEVLLAEGITQAAGGAALGLAATVLVGGAVGAAAAGLLVLLLARYWIPDFLDETATLALVIGAFVLSDLVRPESGLLAVTVMGMVLANQKRVPVKHIVEFKENLRILLISLLFLALAARMTPAQLVGFGWGHLAFLVALVLVARPAAVALSAWGSTLSWRERLFVAGIAPRGIVAAAVSAVFALRLERVGVTQAEQLVPVTFFVIVGTVALYGLGAAPLARALGLTRGRAQGTLIVGAQEWVRALAARLQEHGVPVMLVDTNRDHVRRARLEGLPAYDGNILDQDDLDEIDLGGLGRLLALTPNDEVNALAALHGLELFSREEVYQLVPQGELKSIAPAHLHGRLLFGPQWHHDELARRWAAGWRLRATPLSETFDMTAFREHHGPEAVPLFLLGEDGQLLPCTVDAPPQPRPGHVLLALVPPEREGA